MYERFFCFRDQPFRLTPDPRYLYLGSKHREGYAHLLYALREGSGFVAVTGEVGTGKTTLVRALLRESHDNVAVAYIFNPVLSSIELLQTINAEFGLPSRSTSKKELTEALNQFLLSQKLDGGRAVIIVDEAQNLDPAVLEQLRLLSNLETETEKLLQIILLGQPELRTLLERPDLRQLSQRISLRWHLEPLDREEAERYLDHRVRVAGGRESLFDARAADLVHQLSGGVPRLINILAHRALLVAYTKGVQTVSAGEVGLAAVELEQCRVPLRARNAAGWAYKAAAGAAVAVAACVVAFLLVWPLGEEDGTATIVPERAAVLSGGERPVADAKKDMRRRDRPAPEVAAAGADEKKASSETEKDSARSRPAADARSARAADVAAAPADDETLLVVVERLAKRLDRSATYDAAAGAMSRLIELWTGQSLTPAEVEAGSLDLQLFGARRGLRYLAAELAPRQVEVLDLPAVIELDPQDGKGPRYVLLEQLDEETARIVLDKPYKIDRRAVEKLWTGQVHLLWRDPQRLSRPLAKGSTGPAVEKLQEMLATAGYLERNASGEYDDLTEKAVRRFQKSCGVAQNGEASTLTQILLYNALPDYKRPELRMQQRQRLAGKAS